MCLYNIFFFFNDTATTEIYTLSLHDALPICIAPAVHLHAGRVVDARAFRVLGLHDGKGRSEEHTSELQSHLNLVCRLLLEKKKQIMHLPNELISISSIWTVVMNMLIITILFT